MADQTDMREAILRTLSGENLPPDAPYGTGIGEINRRYNEMGPVRRGLAGISNTAFSIPILRSTGLPEMISSDSDRYIAREARPSLSALENVYGRSLPYVALGTSFPAAFSSVPRTLASSSLIAGPDAAFAGESVPQALSDAAIGSVVGPVLGKAITPKSAQEAFAAQWNRAIEHANTVRGAIRDTGAMSFPGHWSPTAMRFRGHTLTPEQRQGYRDTFVTGINRVPPPSRNPYTENQILDDQGRALLNALMSPYSQSLMRE